MAGAALQKRQTLDWTRIARISVWLLATAVLVAGTPATWMRAHRAWQMREERRIDPLGATDEEQASIVGATLSSGRIGLQPPPWPPGMQGSHAVEPQRLVLVDDLAQPCGTDAPIGVDCSDTGLLLVRQRIDAVPLQRLREWAALTRFPGRLRGAPGNASVAATIGREELLRHAQESGMAALIRRHDADGIVQFSRAALDADRSSAFIYVAEYDSNHSGQGFFLLVRAGNVWQVAAVDWQHFL